MFCAGDISFTVAVPFAGVFPGVNPTMVASWFAVRYTPVFAASVVVAVPLNTVPGAGPTPTTSWKNTLAVLVFGLTARKKLVYPFCEKNTCWKEATVPLLTMLPKDVFAAVRLKDGGVVIPVATIAALMVRLVA